MATRLELNSAYRRVTVDEFLRMDLGDAKAELVDGVIFMMAGAGSRHNRIAANVLIALGIKLQGGQCQPYGSDQAVRTTAGTIRYPDVSVYCDDNVAADDDAYILGDPTLVVEVLSPSTAANDQLTKLGEYQRLLGTHCILIISPETQTVRKVEQAPLGTWTDRTLGVGEPVAIKSLHVELTGEDIFGRR